MKALTYERYGGPEVVQVAEVDPPSVGSSDILGVYLGDLERIDPGGVIRGGMNCGKSCLRVRKRDDLGVVEALIGRKVEVR